MTSGLSKDIQCHVYPVMFDNTLFYTLQMAGVTNGLVVREGVSVT